MKLLHSMIRVLDLDASLHFYCDLLGMIEHSRREYPNGRFTLVFLRAPDGGSEVELTHNWDETSAYSTGRNFGHLAFSVENIYATCQHLMDNGVAILRPPRDGHMAFVKCPDQISIEILQAGDDLPPAEPWTSMQNQGSW
jgi:lactoylglutathione lyase